MQLFRFLGQKQQYPLLNKPGVDQHMRLVKCTLTSLYNCFENLTGKCGVNFY